MQIKKVTLGFGDYGPFLFAAINITTVQLFQ